MASLTLCSRDLGKLLLDANSTPSPASIGYVSDLRHIFVRRLEHDLVQAGVQAKDKLPQYLSRSKATILDCDPFNDKYGYRHDADFCFGYGAGDSSFLALNYRSKHERDAPLPRCFIDPDEPMLLGNFAIAINAPASSLFVFPPPELRVAGIAEVATAKFSSAVMWLGVRYIPEKLDANLINDVEQLVPINLQSPTPYKQGSCYGSVFYQYFSGDDPFMSPEKEKDLRISMGYPPKGKPIRERILYDSVCMIFGSQYVVRRYRGKELDGLELDIWVPSLHLGIEYQGQQHYRKVRHWHGTSGFRRQQARDKKKRELCKKLGILLLYFNEHSSLDRDSVISILRFHRLL